MYSDKVQNRYQFDDPFRIGTINANFASEYNNVEDKLLAQDPQPQPQPTPAPTPAPTVPAAPTPAPTQEAAELLNIISRLSQGVNESRVIELINEHSAPAPAAQHIHVENHTIKCGEGIAHRDMPILAAAVAQNLPVCLFGEAGSGKSYAAKSISESMEIPYFQASCTPDMTSYSLMGYIDANGNYIETAFYKAYSNGGLFLLDEVDNSNPAAIAGLNSAIANGYASFPIGMVQRHQDFRIVYTSNTNLRGGTAAYQRQPLDMSIIDRLIMLSWNIDTELEKAMIGLPYKNSQYQLEPLQPNVNLMYDIVKTARDTARNKAFSVHFSPRVTVAMCKLVGAGIALTEAVEMCILSKCTANEVSDIQNAILKVL